MSSINKVRAEHDKLQPSKVISTASRPVITHWSEHVKSWNCLSGRETRSAIDVWRGGYTVKRSRLDLGNIKLMQNQRCCVFLQGRTSISSPPMDRRVIKGTTAILECGATHDPRVEVRWVMTNELCCFLFSSGLRTRFDCNVNSECQPTGLEVDSKRDP